MSRNTSSPADPSSKVVRVLMVNVVETGFNGQTMFIVKYLRNMDRRDMHIGYVAINEPPAAIRDQLEGLGLELFILDMRNRRPASYIAKLARLIRSHRYSIVHAHGNSATLLVEMLAARLGGARVRIAHSHNTSCGHPAINRVLNPLFQPLVNIRMACGEDAGRWMFGKRPFEVVPIASEFEPYRFSRTVREDARKEMGIAAGEILIGMVAIFNEVKNHAFLLQSFADAVRINPGLRLVLIGDGPLRSGVQSLCAQLRLEDRVIFTGSVGDVPKRLQAMDALVLPSLHEGFPNVLVEAQLSGLPVLVSERVTRDCDMTGLLRYLPLESTVWAEAMSALVPADHRLEASENGCERAAARGFDVRQQAAKLKERYLTLDKGV